MARAAAGTPMWVKVFIGIGIVAVLIVALLVAGGHGPWQHSAMGNMHQ